MISWDEASKCPKCKKPGEVIESNPTTDTQSRPLMVRTLECKNPLCPWVLAENPRYFVAQYPDGSIMQPQGGRDKQFVMPAGGSLAIAENMKQVNDYAAAIDQTTLRRRPDGSAYEVGR